MRHSNQITHSLDRQSKNNIKWHNMNPFGKQAKDIKHSQSPVSFLVPKMILIYLFFHRHLETHEDLENKLYFLPMLG